MKPLEQTVSIVAEIAAIPEGDIAHFDISEYEAIRQLLHAARHKRGQVTKPLWDHDYTLRKFPKMNLALVGRIEGEQ